MKCLVSVDSFFSVLRVEALAAGSTMGQMAALYQLEGMTEVLEDYDPYRMAILSVERDTHLRILLSEADKQGTLIANGEWLRISVDPHGAMSMTTSHDPEWIEVLAAPL